MALHDYNSDETRLSRGLGRLAEDADYVVVNDATGSGSSDYTTTLTVPDRADVTDSTNEVPDSAIRTMLPALQLATATGTTSCTDCTPAAAATAAATAAAVVTPMPAAPTTVNWLLIVLGLGLTYAVVKSNSPSAGLGCAPEPEPAPAVQQDLGRPPRKRKEASQHVDSLSI